MDPNAALTTIPITPQAQPLGDPDDIILPPPPTTPNHNMGPFTQRCHVLGISTPAATETVRMKAIHQALFIDRAATIETRITIIGEQPQPFPVIAIRQQDNHVVVLHSLKRMVVPLGSTMTNHPAHGKVLAFLGDTVYPGVPPQVVIVPDSAFEDAQAWPMVSDTSLRNIASTTQVLPAPVRNATTTQTTKVHPIPPSLVPFFFENNQECALAMFMKFRLTHEESEIAMQELSARTLLFLRAAATRDASSRTNPKSQLAITIQHVDMDATIAQWANARFASYLHHPMPPQIIQPPVDQTQNNPATNTFDPMAMAELMAQAVAQAMQTVPNRNMPTESIADPDLDAIAANSHLPAMSGIAQANMLSWCGVMTTGVLPQIWTLFCQAESDATRLTILDRFLQAKQEINFHINYMLHPEVIRDISEMKFWYPPHIELINRGITPFTIQKLTIQQESNLQIFEDTAQWATHVGMNDITA